MSTTQPMNPSPGADRMGVGRDANSPMGPGALKHFRGGELITAEMTAPTSEKQCVHLARARRVEFVVRLPAGLVGCVLHYGRWVRGTPGNGSTTALDNWIEDGTRTIAGASGPACFGVAFETHGDACAVYVDTFDGTPTAPPADRIEFWYRPLDG